MENKISKVNKANHKHDNYERERFWDFNSINPLLAVLDRITASLEKIYQDFDINSKYSY